MYSSLSVRYTVRITDLGLRRRLMHIHFPSTAASTVEDRGHVAYVDSLLTYFLKQFKYIGDPMDGSF